MTTVAPGIRAPASRSRWRAPLAIARRALRDARVRTVAFAYLFAAIAYIQPVSYRHAYPTLADRLSFARSFGANKAVVLFYGKAYDLLSVGGYSAWRVGGTLAIFSAVFGLLAAVRALRTEEETGRAELVLAGPVGRQPAFLGSMAAIAAGVLLLWAAAFLGSVLGGLPAGGSAYLALAVVSVVPVFVGVGALASQIAPTRRMALELGGGVVALAFVLRVIADTSNGFGWLRWATPLGWAEELRPFTGAQPAVLLLPLATAAVLIYAAEKIFAGRDLGSGLLPAHDSAEPRQGLLSSPTAQALRSERPTLVVWLLSVGAFAFIVGVISKSIHGAGISSQVNRELAKLGAGSVLTPKGYLGFSFIFFVLAVSLFACSQISAARQEEATERLETILALPVPRRGWLTGRLALGVVAVLAISVVAGLFAWLGAVSTGVSLSFARMLEAGLNCVPAAILFLGVAALAYALAPRASTGIAYGLVTVAFLWQLFGGLFGAPKWLVDVTPFAHIGFVPAQPFRAAAAGVMLAIGLLTAAIAMLAFERRDLAGA
jgi:ABC-2 type transport system permease protein